MIIQKITVDDVSKLIKNNCNMELLFAHYKNGNKIEFRYIDGEFIIIKNDNITKLTNIKSSVQLYNSFDL